jgi:branched-chain amino acid transport system ATP-binding protein
MTAEFLVLDRVDVRFGGIVALDQVSFSLAAGAMLGLIGPNGAGKTTLLRVITGVIKPGPESRVSLDGTDITAEPTHRRIRRGLALTHQIVRPFASLSVRDNVALAAGHTRLANLAAAATMARGDELRRADEILVRLGIAAFADSAPRSVPLGVLKRLELARALALDARLLLLDEPLAGLNQAEARRLADTIAELNRAGQAMILIEHNLAEVTRICPRLVVLDNGRKIADGATMEVMRDRGVIAAYLGEEHVDAAD